MQTTKLSTMDILWKAAVALVESPSETVLLSQLLENVKRLGFDRARLYLLSVDGTRLVGKAECGMDREFIGLEWPVDIDPHTQALMKDPTPHIFDALSGLPDRFRELLGKTDAMQWAEVPLMVEGEFRGKISVDNKFSRKRVTKSALQPLALFAQLAAAALQKALLLAEATKRAREMASLQLREQEKAERLADLAHAIAQIIRYPSTMLLTERLTLIARHSAKLLDAEACGVLLASRADTLRWVANWGHREGFFEEGQEFEIRSGLRSGLTGHIASEGKVVNLSRDEILAHPARIGNEDSSPSGQCHSILGVPLFRNIGGNSSLIGILRATNKRAVDEFASPPTRFSEEDESIIRIFAEAAVAAIESATLVDSLRERQEFQQELIASSPDAIIAVDGTGTVKVFNPAAENILGYTADEALGRHVNEFYPLGESQRIGQMIGERNKNQEHLAGYDTEALHKNGEVVPIRLSASSWSNTRGQRVGSVGYFKDLRPQRAAQRREQVARRAIDAMAQAPDPPAALANLAKELVESLPCDWSQILLLGEDEQYLEVMAVSATVPLPSGMAMSDAPTVRRRIRLSTRIEELLAAGSPLLLPLAGESATEAEEIYRELQMPAPAISVLIVPVSIGNKLVGLLMGGTHSQQRERIFSEADIDLAKEVAAQTAVAIEPMRWYTLAERHNARLEQLQEAASAINTFTEPSELRAAIVEQAHHLFEAPYVTLWPYDAARKQLLPEQLTAWRIPSDVLDGFREDEPKQGHTTFKVLHSGRLDVEKLEDDRLLEDSPRRKLLQLGVQCFRAIRLSVADEPVGVLYLSYTHVAMPSVGPYLDHFASSAAAALKKNRLSTQIERGKKVAEMVAGLMTIGDRQKTLDAVTYGVADLVGCDIVTLFIYNPLTGKLEGRPSVAGLSPEVLAVPEEKLDPKRLVSSILNRSTPYIADRVAQDPLFAGSTFAKQQGIVSCVAIPLRVGGRAVGALFVSSRTHYRPTAEELTTIQTCADLAAVAIENAQLFQEREKEQRALKELSENLLGVTTVQQTLDRAVAIARDVLEVEYCEITLTDGKGNFTIRAVEGWARSLLGSRIAGERDGSQTGFTVDCRSPLIVSNYEVEERFKIHPDIRRERIRSGLSAPIYQENCAIGAVLVHSAVQRLFTNTDINLLELIANQTSIALRRVEHYEAIERISADLKALWATGKAIFKCLGKQEEKEILDEINRAVVEHIKAKDHKPVLGTIQSYQQETDELTFESIYPLDSFERVTRLRGKKLSVHRIPGHRIGINGRAVEERDAILVANVREDPDYVEFDPRTQSQISVPLVHEDEILGILAVESDELDAFDAMDRATLTSLAQLAVVAIHHTRQYCQLRRTKESVERLTKAIASDSVQVAQEHAAQAIHLALGCDALILYIQNPETKALDAAPSMVGVERAELVRPPAMFRKGSLVYDMLNREKEYISERVEGDPLFGPKRFAKDEGIRACVAAPLRALKQPVGVMFINYRTPHRFTKEEIADITLFANLAAVAIRNAQALTTLKRRQDQLVAIHETGKAITAEPDIDRGKLLNSIVRRAGELFAAQAGEAIATIQVYDEAQRAITIEAAYLPEGNEHLVSVGQPVSIDSRKGQDPVAAQVILQKRAVLVPDVSRESGHIVLSRATQCLMATPLIKGDQALGAISVESPRAAAFDSADLQTLAALAELVVIAIQNSRQFSELRRMKGLVGTRTAMAFMGLMSAVWRHSIEMDATTIRDASMLLRKRILSGGPPQELQELIDRVIRCAEAIIERRPLPPLTGDDELTPTPLTKHLFHWADNWKKRLNPMGISFEIVVNIEDSATARISREWMSRALDLLVGNATSAIKDRAVRRITVACTRLGSCAEIEISDSGPGIPERIRPKILQEVIPKSKTDKGFGTGLLLAQAIFETFRGTLWVERSGPEGTVMKVTIPIES
jgi:PAS domain S-box-containing protein